MSKEDGTLDLTRPDPKDAMSKLNELIALRFDEETNSNDSVSDNIFSQISCKRSTCFSGRNNCKTHISYCCRHRCQTFSANNATGILLEQPITIESEDKDADQELKNRLNELAATGFGEVPYESCELKIEEYNQRFPPLLPTNFIFQLLSLQKKIILFKQ
jgi:hypothetical protein